MICRSCGTEIAEKALICYRCGAPTTEAKFKPPVVAARARSAKMILVFIIALVLAMGGMLYAMYMSGGNTRTISWMVVGVSLVMVILRAVLRRR